MHRHQANLRLFGFSAVLFLLLAMFLGSGLMYALAASNAVMAVFHAVMARRSE